MAAETGRWSHNARTVLRAVVAPSILGLAAPPLAMAAGEWGSTPGFLGGLSGIDEYFTVMLVATPVAGFIASAAAGRDHGWQGYISAAVGVVAGAAASLIASVLWFEVQPTYVDAVMGIATASFLFWVPLTVGYGAHRVVATWVADGIFRPR
jgi:hypothetical protein